MKFVNPVVRGFYPDPSVCKANGKYYLVNSTFQFFPGIPVFESEDLVNWNQVGNCLTRKSQLDLTETNTLCGIYAPTIRFNNGRFYVVVTNTNGYGNFYVYTDDIYGEWSDPIRVDRGGIDPSLLFDTDGKTYFISNGTDDFGEEGISCCEIDISTGKLLTKAKCISKGCGGRYLEGPHLYKINGMYYLMVAEGGTEYGHMECILRSKDIFGPYEKFEKNPILTNRNLGGYSIQGSGHADIIEGPNGQWYMVHLAFRQISKWGQYHNLGRETFLAPIFWTDDGWFTVGADGTSRGAFDVQDGKCTILPEPTYPEYKWTLEPKKALYVRLPDFSNYDIKQNECYMKGTDAKLSSIGNVTFIGMRQKEFTGIMSVSLDSDSMEENQNVGITAYMDERNHYDVNVEKNSSGVSISGNFYIGGKCFCDKKINCSKKDIELKIETTNESYSLQAKDDSGNYISLGEGHSKYLSSEVTEGFTGVILALYAEANSSGKSGNVKFFW